MALEKIRQDSDTPMLGVLVLDIRYPGEMDGMDGMEWDARLC